MAVSIGERERLTLPEITEQREANNYIFV